MLPEDPSTLRERINPQTEQGATERKLANTAELVDKRRKLAEQQTLAVPAAHNPLKNAAEMLNATVAQIGEAGVGGWTRARAESGLGVRTDWGSITYLDLFANM